ncbi:MAG: PhnD/SsuA/transferrin family substrate-binding protein [Methylovulum sp.]|nr:PhnD/SsuA/transferrin family substrate-binding protein [Methylovulum sp.]
MTLGILATNPKIAMEARWQPLAEYLTRSLPGKQLSIRILDLVELDSQLQRHELDFVLTNPGHYMQLRQKNALSGVLATLQDSVDQQPLDALGGVIFTLKQRNDINRLADLKDKILAAPSTSSLGGYQAQAYQLAEAGIAVNDDVRLLEAGMPHDNVVDAVLKKKADVGFVRTGVLETMDKAGKLKLNQFKILNRQDLPSFPYVLSTRLYPNWPFVATPNVDEELARQVTALLLMIEHEGPLARAFGYHGFTIPADYGPVEDLLRALRLPPFDTAPTFTWRDIIVRYRYQAAILALAGVVIGLLALLLLLKNRQLRQARNHAREGENKLAAILDNLGACIYIKDTHYRYQFVNHALCELFGAPLSAIVGHEADDFFTADNAGQTKANDRRVLENGERLEIVETNTFKITGQQHSHLSIKLPLRDSHGHIYALCGISTDITPHKKVEAELHRSNADLEQFAYAISHDMRQPLRMVSSYLSLIERALAAQLDDDTRQYLAFAIDGAKRMDQMILSLLDFSRIGRITAPMARIASREVLAEALAFLEPEISASGACVQVSGDWPELVASRDELSRLLQNLISNAVKYHAEGVAPHVDIEGSTIAGVFRVTVRDQGVGIDPAQTDRLFKVFSRLQTRSRFEGTGVGLALCRKIVEHHGGRIGVESLGENQGSCFWFEIPVITNLA